MLRLVLVAAACLVLAAAAPLANTDVITTTLGPVRGKVMEVPDSSGSSVRAFLGIPYAKPPVGALRFRSPEAAAAWSDTLDAFEQGPACHQINDEHIFDGHMSEDCLTLNIWTPPDATEASKLPVMLWVYGGSFVKGGTRDPVFDARNLAHRTGVVVVSVNYRLGALGWMVHPGNTRTVTTRNGETHETAGNYGLMDQRLAMEFVVANVAKFGGDPKHITAFGESAGGISLCMQMAADYSYEPTVVPGPPPSGPDQGLPDRHLVPFQQVILLSGPCVQGLGPALPTYTSWKFRTDAAKQLAKALACSNADAGREFECIASRPASEIIAAQVPLDWGPVTDYVLIPDDPLAMFSQQREAAAAWFPDTGEITEVAVIAGFVHDEGTLFVPDKDLTHAQMKGGMVQNFPQNSATVYDKYAGTDSSAYYEFANALGDQFFMCPTRRLLDLLPQAPVARYGYLFNHAPSFVDERHAHMRSFHSSELFFVFGNPRAGFSFTDGEKRLSQRMMDMFGSFARTGAPTTLEVWPSYESFTRPLLVFNTDPSPPVTHNHKQDVCDFWDSMTLLFE